jgi:hypothetical protein
VAAAGLADTIADRAILENAGAEPHMAVPRSIFKMPRYAMSFA